MWDVLNSREWAVVFWVAVVAALAVLTAGGRKMIVSVAKIAVSRSILLTLFWLYFWLVVVVVLAERVGLWDSGLLKDTAVWFVVGGLAIPFAALRAPKEDAFFRRQVVEVLGLATFVAFFLNLRTFPFIVEVLLQAVVFVLAAVVAVAGSQKALAPARSAANALLYVVYAGVFVGSIWLLAHSWRSLDATESARALALSIWLPLASIPFLYALAFFMAFEQLFVFMRFRNDGRLSKTARLGVILASRGRLRFAHDLRHDFQHSTAVAEATTLGEVRRRVAKFEADRAAQRPTSSGTPTPP